MTSNTATTRTPAPTTHERRGAVAALVARWPTWLAVAGAALMLYDVGHGTDLSVVLPITAGAYLAVAVLERPQAVWFVVFGALATVMAMRVLGVDEYVGFLVVAAVLAAVGLARGSLRRTGLASLQAPVSVVFISAALLATAISPEVGLYVAASGLLAHGAWDAYHWWADRVVSRSFAEWCGVLDLLLGVGILVLV